MQTYKKCVLMKIEKLKAILIPFALFYLNYD